MPEYDYLCPGCGPFSAIRPMAEFDQPHPCAQCSSPSPRALLSAPALSGLGPGRRRAGEVNERSANAPKRASRHPASCGCCSAAGRTALRAEAVPAAKSFPGQRPWMLGH